MYTVKFLKQAELEITEAYEWYEEKQKGLAAKFDKELNRYIRLISKNPFLFNVRFSEKFRFANLDVFPYIIVYTIDKVNHVVYVNSVFHTSRNPHIF